jgi:hypothetical protein
MRGMTMRSHRPYPMPQRPMRPPASPGFIEWEELPSLADTLAERLVVLGTRHRDALAAARVRAATFERVAASGRVWDPTRPADLEPALAATEPFSEPLRGLAMREVREPEVFRHFFGRTPT